MEKISIIVPVYNASKHIKRCIESILNQTYPCIELILVDDGSTDDSGSICDEYQEKQNIKIIHKKNGGVSSARNVGLAIASGVYIGFVDSDDYVEENMFQLMHDGMSGVDLVMCGYFQNEEKHFGVSTKSIVSRNNAISYIVGNGEYKGYLWNKLFKKSIIDEFGLQFASNIHMCEDLLFCVLYIDKMHQACLLPENLYHYEDNNDSISNSRFTVKKYSVVEAYNILLGIDIIAQNKKIFDEVKNRKIKHCLSLWNLLRGENLKKRQTYIPQIKRQIKRENMSFLWAKEYSLKYKLLFLILKIY